MTTTHASCPVWTRLFVFAASLATVLGAGMVPPAHAAKAASRNPEDLLIVDCLLPGQIRKMGKQAVFQGARRPIRTTQADCEIRGGEYVSYDRANYQTALKVWMDQAMAGSAEAQNYVGEIYSKGLGTPPDYEMAALWFKKSAEQGFKRAKINLGYLYEQGLGVDQDMTKALNLYRDASGISGDDIVFASTVKLQMEAKEAEIGALRQDVQQAEAEAARLRSENSQLKGQLDNRRAALEQSEKELENTRLRLNQARAATGVDTASLDRMRKDLNTRASELDKQIAALAEQKEANDRKAKETEQKLAELKAREAKIAKDPAAGTAQALADIRSQTSDLSRALTEANASAASVQSQLASNQAMLDEERKKYQAEIAKLEAAAAGRKQEDWELMKLLENQLAAKESEIRQQNERIASLERRTSTGTGATGGALAAAVPTLEIIDPPLTATRGKPAAMLRGAAGKQDLVGKISAPQGVKTVSVNGAPAPLAADGVFRSSVDVKPGGTQVVIAAVDSQGTQAQLEFMMIPQGGGGSVASAPEPTATGVPSGVKLGKYHAIVVGNNQYQSADYPALQSAANDATAVAQVLKSKYGYETKLLLNATRFDILSALNEARETLTPGDNLLVYYAGHGEISADGQQGYWIPVDAQGGVASSWISNGAISEILDTMQAQHVLVVADSCYSGAMTRSAQAAFDSAVMPADKWAEWVKTMAAGRSRTALVSGGVMPVPDTGSGKHSYFARAFLNALEDNNRLLEAQRLFREVSSSLALAAVDAPVTQIPEYSPIRYAGHEAGEFFFAPKGGAVASR